MGRESSSETETAYQPHLSVDAQNAYSPSVPVQLDASVLGRVKEFAKMSGIRRSSVLTAACALFVRGWRADGSDEVVLDFPVSRRVDPASKVHPGMFVGVVPLVLNAAPNPRSRTSVRTWTYEHERRCGTGVFRSERAISAARGRCPIGSW